MAYDVFISYSRKDKEKAESLCAALEEARISYWIDRNIHGSANFLSEITAYIKGCKVVVFVASANSANSEWTQKEILYALKHKKEIVPYRIGTFRFEDNDELDFVFTNVQWVESERAVVESLKKLGCLPKPKPTPIPKPKPAPTPIPQPKPAPAKTYKVGDYYDDGTKQGVVAKNPLFDVVLKKTGQAKLGVIKAVKELTGLSLGDAKALVDSVPRTIVERISKNEAESIKYAFEEIGAEVAVVENSAQVAAKTYRVGDYYDDGKKQGVVFEVTPDGKHGKIVSLQEGRCLSWAVNRNFSILFNRDNPSQKRIGADDKYNGANNMAMVKWIAVWREKYPAFAWCADLGEGWYLPAIEELKKFTLGDAIHDAVNRALAAKGEKLANKGENRHYYWSSTEFNESRVWSVYMHEGRTGNNGKDCIIYVRAVAAF